MSNRTNIDVIPNKLVYLIMKLLNNNNTFRISGVTQNQLGLYLPCGQTADGIETSQNDVRMTINQHNTLRWFFFLEKLYSDAWTGYIIFQTAES